MPHEAIPSVLFQISRFTSGHFAPMAYLDPGSGSYLLQILIATFVGGLFALRASWGRIRSFFQRRFKNNKDSHSDEE